MTTNLTKVQPVDSKELDGTSYSYKYKFDEVHGDEIPEDIQVPDDVSIEFGGDEIKWQYRGKVPIHIRDGEVYHPVNAPKREARNQAYFCLSILADKGYVSGWRRA